MPKLADCLKVTLDRPTYAKRLEIMSWLEENMPHIHEPGIYCEFCAQKARRERREAQKEG